MYHILDPLNHIKNKNVNIKYPKKYLSNKLICTKNLECATQTTTPNSKKSKL